MILIHYNKEKDKLEENPSIGVAVIKNSSYDPKAAWFHTPEETHHTLIEINGKEFLFFDNEQWDLDEEFEQDILNYYREKSK